MTRGRFRLGKEPIPFKRRSKQLKRSVSARSICESISTFDGETSPRNFNVKCMFSIGTQRISAPISFLNLDVAAPTALRISRGSSTATNARRRLRFSSGWRLAVQRAFYSLFEFEEADGFGEIGRRPCFHPISDIRGHALRRNHHHRNIGKRGILTHPPQDIQTGNFRHHNIEQNNVWLFFRHHGEGRRAGGSLSDAKAADSHHLSK